MGKITVKIDSIKNLSTHELKGFVIKSDEFELPAGVYINVEPFANGAIEQPDNKNECRDILNCLTGKTYEITYEDAHKYGDWSYSVSDLTLLQ